ncbi:MAG: hypothetical protein NQU46_03210 [Methanolinea sp.]|nr:hypothetical protein [Methanolinea sp.]
MLPAGEGNCQGPGSPLGVARWLRAHPVKVRRLARACGGRCEHCGISFSLSLLSAHVFDPYQGPEPKATTPECSILVLCPECSLFFASGKVDREAKRMITGFRPPEVALAMREILLAQPRSYSPPENNDPARIFDEMCRGGALDLCLNGG